MKVLLDEDLPHMLRHHLPSHEVVTVRFAGWDGLRNGALLRTAEDAGFEVLLTGDKKIPREQNLQGRAIAVVVLSAQEWPIIRERREDRYRLGWRGSLRYQSRKRRVMPA